MKDTIRRQKLFLFSLIGVVVTSFALLSSFAYQTLKVDIDNDSSDNLTVSAGVLDVKYTTSRTVNIDNMPLLNTYKTADYTEFEIDNTNSTEDVLYRLKLVDLSYSENLTNGDFRYTIVSVNDNKETVISEDTFANLNESEYVFSTKYDNYIFIKSGEVQKLRIYFWLQETQSDQNYLENTKFVGKMQVESIFSRDSLDKVIMNFKVYGNTLLEDKNEYNIDNQRNVSSLGKLITDTNDNNYGKYEIDLEVNGNNIFRTDEPFVIDNNWVYQSVFLSKGTYRLNYISNDFNLYKVLDENNNIIKEDSINNVFEITKSGNYKVYIGSYNFKDGIKPADISAILSKGDSVVNYEPSIQSKKYSIYLNKPLSCINDICDYIDFIDSVVYRNIGYIKLSGKEEWNKVNSTYSIKVKNIGNSFEPISNSFKYGTDFNIKNNLLSINTDIDDINIFKSKLMSNNVNVIYPLKNEEKELISTLNISEFKEKNILVTDGVLNSDNVVIEYNK